MKSLLYIALLLGCGLAQAAKVEVSALTPTQNEPEVINGVTQPATPLTDLAKIIIEWGSCNGSVFGTRQSAIEIQTTQIGTWVKTFIYPTGLTKVCIRAYAVNALGTSSRPSEMKMKDLLPATGKPVTLGQPVVLPQ